MQWASYYDRMKTSAGRSVFHNTLKRKDFRVITNHKLEINDFSSSVKQPAIRRDTAADLCMGPDTGRAEMEK